MGHMLKMLLGCMLPLLLLLIIFPALGVTGNWQFIMAALAMVACHVLMMGGHHHDRRAPGSMEGGHHGQA